MKSLFRNFFGAHCLAVCCAFALNGNAEAQTFDDYFQKDIVLAAKKDGVAYAMTSELSSDGRADKQEIKINDEQRIIYLASQDEQKAILWYVGKNSSNKIYLGSKNREKTYLYVDMTTGNNPHPKLSNSKTNYLDFNESSYHTFTYTYEKNLYGILMQPSCFRMELTRYINDKNYLYPIAKPYFLAEHTWRTLGSSNFGTICFPKAVRADDVAGATFYEIAAQIVDNGEFKGVVLNEVTGDLAAGTPYIFKRASDATYIVAAMHGDAAKAASHNGLVGTLKGSEEDGGFEVPPGMYILQSDQLWLTTTGQSRLLAGRAYINPDEITRKVASAEVSSVKGIVLGTDAPADGVRATMVAQGAQGTAFDLQGRLAGRLQHGHIYLINGHKVYIK